VQVALERDQAVLLLPELFLDGRAVLGMRLVEDRRLRALVTGGAAVVPEPLSPQSPSEATAPPTNETASRALSMKLLLIGHARSTNWAGGFTRMILNALQLPHRSGGGSHGLLHTVLRR
jgi:hypothetical protein